MHVPTEVDVTDVFEIRVLKTDDGKQHGFFNYQFSEPEEVINNFCEETEYQPDEVTHTDKTV